MILAVEALNYSNDNFLSVRDNYWTTSDVRNP